MGKAVKPETKHDVGSMTDRQRAFAREYTLDFNGKNAAIRAGYALKSAANNATLCLEHPLVQAEIQRLMQRIEERSTISGARVLQEAWGIATADVNDLVEFRRTCCRHCYGDRFERQRTMAEFNKAQADYLVKRTKAMKKADFDPDTYEEFDEQGGIGYDARKPPNPDCMECFGDGIGSTYFKDTRNLSPAARALYAGVKQTKDGHQMLLVDKLAAMEKLFKHLGLYKIDNQQKTDALGDFLQAVQDKAGRLPIKPQESKG